MSGSIDLFARAARQIRAVRAGDLGSAPDLFDVEILTFDRWEVAGSGSVALEGLAPALAVALRPAAGSVALEGLAPALAVAWAPVATFARTVRAEIRPRGVGATVAGRSVEAAASRASGLRAIVRTRRVSATIERALSIRLRSR